MMSGPIDCMPTSKMEQADSACNTVKGSDGYCECQISETTDGEVADVPFRYDTQAFPVGVGNGFCVPKASNDTSPAILAIITKMEEQFTSGDGGQTVNGWF